MALGGSRLCCSSHQNLLIDFVEDELAKDPGSVGGPHLGSASLVPSCNPIPGPKLVLALISAPVPAPTLPSFDKLFKQFMKAYLELNQGPRQPPTEGEWPLKAKVSEVYYDKLYIDCYHFC